MNEIDRYRIFIRDMFTCQNCGKRFSGWQGKLQIAHRIKQGEGTLDWIEGELEKRSCTRSRKWIQDNIIDHPDNTVTACSLACNDSFNLFYNRIEADKLLDKILNNVLIPISFLIPPTKRIAV